MTNPDLRLRILLLNDRQDDADHIKTHLSENMRVPWDIHHCMTIQEAEPRFNKSDIVILDLSLIGTQTPEDIFKHVGNLTPFTPVIALIGEGDKERDLGIYVMERGAADAMMRGRFGRLVDAIEFALIRQKISINMRTVTDKTLADSEAQGKTDLASSQSSRERDLERHKQILSMFGGDYSASGH